MPLDLTLYLVTDTTPAILGTRDLRDVVRHAVRGGATIVQHRDKTSDTATLISMSRSLHAITSKAGIPLLINDRVDVALAIGAEGVHLGQDDMDVATARSMLGPDKFIGITVSNKDEAEKAIRGGADYLGIGTMFSTSTKKDTKDVIGTAGTQGILEFVAEVERSMRGEVRVGTVAIGGINESNVQRVMYQSQAPSRGLDGVAVVSALVAAADPEAKARRLRELIAQREEASFATLVMPPEVEAKDLVEVYLGRDVLAVVKRVQDTKPLCHNMTNLVVQNFAANVVLAVGGSPIMANDGNEAKDLAALGGSLVINMGSATPAATEQAIIALNAYNAVGGPVLFDPVGAGATAVRREAVKKLMAAGYFDVIKGNESEILSVSATSSVQQKGVDSGDSGLSPLEKAKIVKTLAERQRNIVLMTGKEDYLSDGTRVLVIKNGHPLLGQVTGTGCTLGATIAAMLAVEKQDKLLATLTGLLVYEIAAERAARHPDVKGPGTFVPHFIDALADIAAKAKSDNNAWLGDDAKVTAINLEVNGVNSKREVMQEPAHG